ncbi:MAG: acyl-[acyl-carrier-protein] thioesterase [Lachnospiraceae bacterium]|nr:acyl-[acyl-carrier-protein] thioesterase [Lachnospiraceae bacterium]
MENAYTFLSRVRYSEVDADRELSLVSVLNYFQDCSTFQSEDLGIGLIYLRDRNLFWVVNAWQIDVLRYPVLGEKITLGTSPHELKGFLGLRNFMMWDETGELIVKANSVWSLLDTQTYRPVKCTPEILEKYVIAEKLDMEYLPRKIALPETMEKQDELTISRHHLDTNHHVNNGKYVEIGAEYVNGEKKPRRLRAEYLKQAVLGDTMSVYTGSNGDSQLVKLADTEGKAFAVLSFDF